MSPTKRRLPLSFTRRTFVFGDRILQFIAKWSSADRKRLKSRLARLEQLETRQVFAAAVWTNVLQPLDVNGDSNSEISPLDALLVINELNNRVYAPQFQRLPSEVDDALKTTYVDVTCDGLVSPIDALLVINRLNARSNGATDKPLPGSPTWKFTETGGSASAKGKYQFNACSPRLVEGDSYSSQLSATVKVIDSSSAVRVQFSAPVFDVASQNSIRDAVEILVLDENGQALTLPFDFKRDASFNWTESLGATAGAGTQTVLQTPDLVSTATFNLSGIAAGTNVQVVVRLVNNDSDKTSNITIRKLDVVSTTETAPTGMRVTSAATLPPLPKPDPTLLVDVSSSVVPFYGRTAVSEGGSVLSTEVQLLNQGLNAISGRMFVVVEKISELDVSVLNPDGYFEGKPYFVLNGSGANSWLSTGQSTDKRELQFKNLSGKQFTYSLTALAELNQAPSGFTSSPLLEIEAGKTYHTTVRANDPDSQALVYSIAVGPQAASINAGTGEISWNTATGDVGNHSVVVKATDPFGLSVQQSFSISVKAVVANRPPAFTSTPTTEATVASPFEVLTYQTGSSPIAAAAGDFGTGKLSIITANPGEQQLGLLSGNGNTQFGSTQGVSVGEINPIKFSTPFVTGAAVDLGFVPNTYTNNERNVLSVINADVNGDGNLDLAVAVDTDGGEFGPSDIGSVGVRLGNGDGTFRDGWQVQLPAATLGGSGVSNRADSIRFADVNGDGRLDLVVVQSLGSKALVYAGNGDGTFENAAIESVVNEPFTYTFSSQLGDMNNDGKLDLVSYEYQRDGRYRTGTNVRFGDGTGKFSTGSFYANPNSNSLDGYLADVNGDGKLDTVRLNYNDSRVEARLNDGTGLLGDLKFSGAYYVVGDYRGGSTNPTSGWLADYNRDGKTDIVLSTVASNFLLLIGNGDGTFGDATEQGNRLIAVYAGAFYNTPLQNFSGAGRNDGKAPDLNADGIPDFVFGNQQVDQLTTAINDGTGKFSTRVYQSGFSDDIGNGSVRGSNPTPHLSVGDFNNDGVSDVLLGRDQTNGSRVRVGGVGIALGGNEPGSLRLPQVKFSGTEDIAVGNGSQVLADFDNDGLLDIASNIRSGVAIAKGRADGSFETYATGFNQFGVFPTESLITSDFDRDGNMDIAYMASLNNPGHAPSMTTLFGLGNRTFQRAAAPVPVGWFGPGTISQQYGVAADVNGDGYPDLVYRVPNNHSNFATAKSLVVYLYDPSTHNLKLVTDRDNLLVTPHRGGFYQDDVVAFEDLDGDGKKEIITHSGAIGQNGITDTPERLTIWQPTNNSTATDASDLFTRIEFQNPGISPGLGVEGSINALLVADYSHDGKPDLAVGSQNGTTRVLFGNGDFTFRSPVTYSTNQATGLKTADVNGDGNLDLIPIWSGFFNFNDLNNAGVLLGRSDGSFGAYQGLTTANYELNSPVIGDFNQDGRDDINYGNYFASRLTVLAASPGLASVATGDINGDGKLDVVALDTGFARVKILLGNGDNTFTRQKDLITGLQPESLLLEDINGDGTLDVLTANRVGKSVSIFSNNGTGSFTRSDLALASQPNRIAVGDLNGDGKPDIIAISEKSQSLSTLLSTASGFAAAVEQPIGFAAADLVIADLTLDGKLDAILSDPSGKRLMTLPGHGNGTFGVPVVQPLQQQPGKVAVADLNADGKPDIIATFPNENQVGILFGRGAGRLTSPQLMKVGENPASISVKDINGDSKPDLLVANSGDDTLSVIVNRYDPSSVYRYTPTATDPDADPVTFELLNAPGGALYDEATQTVVWAPMPDQVGENALVVRASDGRGGFAEQGFTVTVTAPVAIVAPSFTSEPITEVSSDQAFVYQPRISNPDEGPLRYSLVDGPEGATIDPTTGVVNWDPRENGISLGVRGSFNYPNNIENRGGISIPASPSINSTSFTAEGWYKFDSLDNTTLFRKYHSSFYNSWTLSSFFGTLRAEINNFGNTPDVRLDTIRLTTNAWYHIAFAYDDTTRLAQIFVNGELVGSVVSTGSPLLSDGALSVDGFEGTVANMRFWNRSLTTQEVRNSMSQPIPSSSPGLVIDYHFAEGPASVAFVDSSPFGNNGSLFINGDFSRYNFPTRIPSIAPSVTVPFSIRVDDGKGGVAIQSFSVTTLPPFPKNIQGTVFDDINGNGIKDGVSESGLIGQVVFVDQNGNLQLDASESRATTDASGNYSLAYVGTQANLVLVGKPGRIQAIPSLPSLLVDLSSGNASGINFATKVVTDGNPAYVSVAPTTASVPGEFRYQAYAQATDGSTIQYAIAVAPNGASVDAMSGLLRWTPKFSDAGPADFILQATDGAGRVSLQAFRVTVSVNTAPFITSSAPTTASQGVLYHYDVQAQDAEQSALNFTFETAPTGATIDALTGKIRWTPSPTQFGSQAFIVVANDGNGRVEKQSFSVNVTLPTTNNSPALTTGPRTSAQVGVTYHSSVFATDADNDLLTYTLISGPANAAFTNQGFISWMPTDIGLQTIVVRVADNRGGTDEQSYTINVGASPVTGSVRFTSSPVTNAVVDRVYAYDSVAPSAKQFQLLAAPIGMSIDPVLGRIRWRPTVEQLGLTTVRIQAMDELGNYAEQSVAINVRRSDLLPTVTSVPPTQTAVGSTYVYVVQADNPSGNPLVYSLSAAPLGMSINSQTGVVSWTSTAAQLGSQSVILRVTDGANNFLTQSFAIQVTASSPNRQPVATSTPPQDATAATPISYRFTATDPDGDNLVYSVVSGPSGLSIDAATGVLNWTPTTAQIGTVAVTLKAADSLGAAAVQSFLIDVRGANRAPSITSVAPQTLAQGGLYRYDIIASDPDREPLFYELRSGPQGMTIDSLGRLRWQTALDTPIGQRQVSVRVTDGRGGAAVQDFNLNIVADTIAPRISILTSGIVLSPWNRGPSTVKVQAVDNVAVSSIQFFVDGQAVPLRGDGTADIYYTAPGNGRMLAYAFDPAGNRGSTTNNILMCSGEEECIPAGSTNQPQTTITNIADGDSVTGFVEIVGTASATDFESYELSYRRSDQATYTTIKNSTTAASNGLIGKWDTTLLENDSYILRLEARDKFGGFSAIERSVGVSGNLKLGNFRLSFSDLTIPVAGIPITLVRTYDTLRADRSSDFGYGWRMDYRNTDLRTSLPKTGLEDQGIYSAFKPGTKVYLTLPGGQREGFTFTPDIRVLPGFGGQLVIATPRFTPDRGVKNKLSAGSGNLIVNERGELYASGGIPWNPSSPDFAGYTLTTPEGIQYKVDGTGNLTAAVDRNGNTLSFSDSGVTSSSEGLGISIERNNKGRIASVSDPSGKSIRYTYNRDGDLISVIDREGNTTQYEYRTDRKHYLEKVIDPLGRMGVRANYAADGRLNELRDGNGGGSTITYDPDNHLVSTRDSMGNTTVSEYDAQGNIVLERNAIGAVTRTTYDTNNSITSITDALGRITNFERDELGNEISRTTPLGNKSFISYDGFGNILSETSALGQTTRNFFDSKGNLVGSVDIYGARSVIANDPAGQVKQITNTSGSSISMRYSGNKLTESTDQNGLTTAFQYNANGSVTSRASTVQTASGPTVAIESITYDSNDQMVSITDPTGATVKTAYDSAGQVVSVIDALNRTTRYEYDAAGHRIRTIFPDGSNSRTIYDSEGRLVTKVDQLGHLTHYQYDAIGQLLAEIHPDETPDTLDDNPRVRNEYDLVGQLIASVNELGGRTEYEYDSDGRKVLVRDPLGNTTRFTYDAVGAVVTQIDANGHTTRFVYGDNGRNITIKNPDGTEQSQQLDEQGLLSAKTDEQGRTTLYAHASGGQIARVTNAIGSTISYNYDVLGNLVRQTDANNHATQFEYDVLGRETARILPGGQRWSTKYDAAGNVIETVDPNRAKIEFTYDELNHVAKKLRSDGQVQTSTYTRTGRLDTQTDSRGVTKFEYDVRDRLVRRTDPDGQAIQYTYDAAGNILSTSTLGGVVRYSYDAAGRLESLTDPNRLVTRYVYDAVGLLIKTEYPNGVNEFREYDENNRLTRKFAQSATQTLLDYRYTLDPTGRVTSFVSADDTVQYSYDAAYRLLQESSSQGRSLSFTYDPVGNRLTQNSSGTITTYEYDVNDRLLTARNANALAAYAYDEAGNQVRTQQGSEVTSYVWDAENKLIQATAIKGVDTTTERFKYDARGNRVSTETSTGETRFLLDLNGSLSQVAAEYSADGRLISTSVRGTEIIGEYRNGAFSLMLTDRIGSVTVVADSTGQVQARYAYDAFGNVVAASGSNLSSLRFAGEPVSRETGLGYFRARYYDSVVGRFISVDPFDGVQENAFSKHRYQYADIDPVNKSDHSGKFTTVADVVQASAILSTISTASSILSIVAAVNGYNRVADTLTLISWVTLFASGGLAIGARVVQGAGGSALGISVRSVATVEFNADLLLVQARYNNTLEAISYSLKNRNTSRTALTVLQGIIEKDGTSLTNAFIDSPFSKQAFKIYKEGMKTGIEGMRKSLKSSETRAFLNSLLDAVELV